MTVAINKFKSALLISIPILLTTQQANADHRPKPSVSALEQDEDGRAILNVSLHGLSRPEVVKTFRFLLDTGSTYTVLDTTVPALFFWDDSVASQVQESTGASATLPLVAVKRMVVGGMTRDDIPAVRMDLKGSILGSFQDHPVDGILGMSFLQGTRFTLDLGKQRLEWWAKPWPDGISLPILFRGGKVPLLALALEGRQGECLLDTAMRGGLNLASSLRPEGKGRPVFNQGMTGLEETAVAMDVPEVVAGGAAWKKVNAVFSAFNCTIGLDVWSAGRTCFDFVADRVTFTSETGLGLAIDRAPKLRLQLCWDRTRRPPGLAVPFVVPGSTVALAGLMPGDLVVQVGPLQGRTLTRRAVQELTAEGPSQQWRVLREGKLVHLRFPQAVP
jgi:hypothetical protein